MLGTILPFSIFFIQAGQLPGQVHPLPTRGWVWFQVVLPRGWLVGANRYVVLYWNSPLNKRRVLKEPLFTTLSCHTHIATPGNAHWSTVLLNFSMPLGLTYKSSPIHLLRPHPNLSTSSQGLFPQPIF